MFAVPAEGYQNQSGAGEGTEHAADPACGSRTELQHINRAYRRQQPSQHLRVDLGWHLCSVGTSAWRGQSGRAGMSADDSTKTVMTTRNMSPRPRTKTAASG